MMTGGVCCLTMVVCLLSYVVFAIFEESSCDQMGCIPYLGSLEFIIPGIIIFLSIGIYFLRSEIRNGKVIAGFCCIGIGLFFLWLADTSLTIMRLPLTAILIEVVLAFVCIILGLYFTRVALKKISLANRSFQIEGE